MTSISSHIAVVLLSSAVACGSFVAGSSSTGSAGASGNGDSGAGPTPLPSAEPAASGAAGAAGRDDHVPAPGCASESCNGKDDDCDGLVDDGCPTALAPGESLRHPALGDSLGGREFADECAADEALVGLAFTLEHWLSHVAGICRRIELRTDLTTLPHGYSLALSEERALPIHPEALDLATQRLVCPDDSTMVGLHITQRSTDPAGSEADAVITELGIQCAKPIISLSALDSRIEWQAPVELGPVIGAFGQGTAWTRADAPATLQLLSGLHGSAGSWIDRIGLTARPIEIVTH